MTVNHDPGHRKCQVFTFGPRRWCIDTAKGLIDRDPAAAEAMNMEITGLDQFLPLTPPKHGRVRLIQAEVDEAYAMTTDLTKPIIVANVFNDNGEYISHIVIDGWHRIYRARKEGRPELPGLLLSEQTERECRIPIDQWWR